MIDSAKPAGRREARLEEGYLVPRARRAALRRGLRALLRERAFATPYNRTVYFNTDDHDVPFDLSVRARTYAAAPTGATYAPDDTSEWYLEVKRSNPRESRARTKTVRVMPFADIRAALAAPHAVPFAHRLPLQPHVAVTYRRTHFELPNERGFRVTVDEGMRYYVFNGKKRARCAATERSIRVELKFAARLEGSRARERVLSLLDELGAVRPLSKKHAAYNAEYRLVKRRYPAWPIRTDTEIESKLSLPRAKQDAFGGIKQMFRSGRVRGFHLIPGFAGSFEYHAASRYVETRSGAHVRLSGDGTSVVYKSDPEVMPDRYGLRCVLRRTEVKRRAPAGIGALPYVSRLRSRKTFLVAGARTGRMYIVLMDRSVVPGHELYQVEIEHISRAPSSALMRDVIDDIAFMTKRVTDAFPFLTPTAVTKHAWVRRHGTRVAPRARRATDRFTPVS